MDFVISNKVIKSLNYLQKLSEEIFSCFLQAEYSTQIYLYEHRIYVAKENFIKVLLQLSNKIKRNNNPLHQAVLTEIEQFFAMLLNCGQLRWRVTDFSIFAVCKDEFIELAATIDTLFDETILTFKDKKYHLNTESFGERIDQLEQSYEHILKVTSREPLVWVLFIAALKNLRVEFENLYQTGLQLRSMQKVQ